MSLLDTYKARLGQSHSSDWFEVTQDQVNTFADVTLDHQFIHVDPERAKNESPFGGPIAHGFLTPVRVGSKIRGTFTLANVIERKPGQLQLTQDAVVEIEGSDSPALIAQWLSLVVEG